MNASMAAVVKSPTNFIKDDNDPCKIFTCLQCFERFPGMTELVEHMSKTKHHFNQTTPNTKPSTTTTNG
uniref:C2H2-type domain-containing protein n=1 Tax=Panagrolaimus sp. PS1159 TaxID=55785 RepID=A0AC35F944_9BILA